MAPGRGLFLGLTAVSSAAARAGRGGQEWRHRLGRGARGGCGVPAPPPPTCQLPLQAAHTLRQAQRQSLQPGGRLWAGHFGEVEVQPRGPPREGQGHPVLLQSDSHGLPLEGCPGEGGAECCGRTQRRRPGPPLPPARAHLNRGAMSSAALRPKRAFYQRGVGVSPSARGRHPKPARPRAPRTPSQS